MGVGQLRCICWKIDGAGSATRLTECVGGSGGGGGAGAWQVNGGNEDAPSF